MKAGAARSIGPDYLPGGVNVFRAVGQIQAQIQALLNFERGVALEGNAVFADVDDLMQIEHRALGFRCETDIGRGLDFMSHTPAAVGGDRSQYRVHGSHGEGPSLVAPY